MRYIIVDLEATCWENSREFDRMETIEIGAVEMPTAEGKAVREFAKFVRPVAERKLSDFCTKLTSIRQEDVDRADIFWTVFGEFMDWIGDEPFVWGSWGEYDLNQLRRDCQRHGFKLPPSMKNHINIKKAFSRVLGVDRCGMAEALKVTGLTLEGTHHRGIDDARNIARLAAFVLPKIEAEGRSICPG
jgi:3'-5' exoribonuclease 1